MLTGDITQYNDPGPDAYNERQRKRRIRNLRSRAASLGFTLVDTDTGELLPA